ncbi:MAG: helix-turn-helix domain-containing protein, partial [Fimbriimonadales bacterium]|nr:helix-turn-helix domain-containing protein [Fimbriimonadales bacterium]
MSRLSLSEWYRYLESQFERAEGAPEPAAQSVPEVSAQPEPTPSEPAPAEPLNTSSSTATPRAAERFAEGTQRRALVSIRVPHFAEFVPLLRQELYEGLPQTAAAESRTATAEPPSDGPRLRKRRVRRQRTPEAIVPPEADETWAKLPKYLRYLAEWTDDQVPRKYYPVRGRDESRAELIARLTNPVLTLEETARLLGVCPATIRRYTDRGWLRCFRTEGNQRRFRLSDIVAFLEEQALRQPRGNRNT